VKEIQLAEKFVVEVPENPTTGFRWRLVAAGNSTCEYIGDDFEPGRAPGEGGMRRWHFRAAQPGETRIELILERPWARSAVPAKRFTLRVRVSS
jgi:inhibitor of cysteine peptidase